MQQHSFSTAMLHMHLNKQTDQLPKTVSRHTYIIIIVVVVIALVSLQTFLLGGGWGGRGGCVCVCLVTVLGLLDVTTKLMRSARKKRKKKTKIQPQTADHLCLIHEHMRRPADQEPLDATIVRKGPTA